MFIHLRCQMEALISRREAMIAANKMRERQGFTIAYGEEAFVELENSFNAILSDPHAFRQEQAHE